MCSSRVQDRLLYLKKREECFIAATQLELKNHGVGHGLFMSDLKVQAMMGCVALLIPLNGYLSLEE